MTVMPIGLVVIGGIVVPPTQAATNVGIQVMILSVVTVTITPKMMITIKKRNPQIRTAKN